MTLPPTGIVYSPESVAVPVPPVAISTPAPPAGVVLLIAVTSSPTGSASLSVTSFAVAVPAFVMTI